ncbi:MAG: phage protein Gp36 family protein [Brevinema sp.]
MVYCEIKDLYEACKKSAVRSWAIDDGRATDEEVTKNITSAITRASEEMNLYLSKQYSLPLPFIPLSLRDICVKLSLYQLLSRKGLNTDSADHTIKVNRDTALKQLEMIASGKLAIGSMVNGDKESTRSILYQFGRSKFQ